MRKTTILLPDELRRRITCVQKESGETFGGLVRRLLEGEANVFEKWSAMFPGGPPRFPRVTIDELDVGETPRKKTTNRARGRSRSSTPRR